MAAAELKKANARKVAPRTLSPQMREALAIYPNREKDPKAYNPAKEWYTQTPAPGLMLPLSDELEDALAALLSRPLRELVDPTSAPTLSRGQGQGNLRRPRRSANP